MDLTTTYLGLKLKNPLVAGAGPLTSELHGVEQLAEHGASAIVLPSLFEEQIVHEQEELFHHTTYGTEFSAEMTSFFPEPGEYRFSPDRYLEHIAACKKRVNVPIIASLNGVTVGGWTEYAKKMEQAGADALELNVYYIAADPSLDGPTVERLYLDILKSVKKAVKIPVAIKIGPFFSAPARMCVMLADAGADGIVLFNRFYQPDIDLETLEVVPHLVLSTPFEMRLPLRWIAIARDHVKISLASSTGLATPDDVLKLVLVGADATQMVSVLLRKGPAEIARLLEGVENWLEDHEYESLTQMKGSLSQRSVADPSAFERANYMKALTSYV